MMQPQNPQQQQQQQQMMQGQQQGVWNMGAGATNFQPQQQQGGFPQQQQGYSFNYSVDLFFEYEFFLKVPFAETAGAGRCPQAPAFVVKCFQQEFYTKKKGTTLPVRT